MNRYTLFDHTADLGVEVFGATREALFVNGAFALFDLLTDLAQVEPLLERTVEATGVDGDDLWVNYLRECLYCFTGEGLLLSDYSLVSLEAGAVQVRMRGEKFDPAKHRLRQEIKAVTYHQAEVKKNASGWVGRVILDI